MLKSTEDSLYAEFTTLWYTSPPAGTSYREWEEHFHQDIAELATRITAICSQDLTGKVLLFLESQSNSPARELVQSLLKSKKT